MVGDECMVKRLFLSHNYSVVGVCNGRLVIGCYCVDYSKLSGNKSSDCKSCEEFENGVKHHQTSPLGRLLRAYIIGTTLNYNQTKNSSL